MTKIIVDGFGGDNAPDEVLKGCRQAADQWDIQVILSGDEQALRRSAPKTGDFPGWDGIPPGLPGAHHGG